MRITIANAKGGTAKTTTAIYLAQAATLHDRHVLVLDADPQGSATEWAAMANQEHHPLPFHITPANPTSLKHRSDPNIIEIIDAAPTGLGLQAALTHTDFTIIPTSDSPLDIQQAWATLTLCQSPAALLLTRIETNTKAAHNAITAIETTHTPLFDSIIKKRQDIKTSMGHQPTKLWEYAQAWKEIETTLLT